MLTGPNGIDHYVGSFEVLSVAELRARAEEPGPPPEGAGLTFDNVVGDVRSFHRDPANAGAVFQVRTPVNNIEYFSPNFEGLVLGCIDADFCK